MYTKVEFIFRRVIPRLLHLQKENLSKPKKLCFCQDMSKVSPILRTSKHFITVHPRLSELRLSERSELYKKKKLTELVSSMRNKIAVLEHANQFSNMF